MENRFEHKTTEQVAWKPVINPLPKQTEQGVDQSLHSTSPPKTALCARVQSRLQPLLENDSDIRPEMAAALYGHLAACSVCTQEFEEMKNVVEIINSLPMMELPMDFSQNIMARLQQQSDFISEETELGEETIAPRPTLAASSKLAGEVAYNGQELLTHTVAHINRTTTSTDNNLTKHQRNVVAAALSVVFVFILGSDWGQQMLNINMSTAKTWLAPLMQNLSSIPLLGWLIMAIGASLASIEVAIFQAFKTMGSIGVIGLAVNLAIVLGAGYLVLAYRQRFAYGRV